jgi:uncharacterized protein (TIGR02302 family)
LNNVTNDSSKSKPGGIGLALRQGLSRVALFWERNWPAIWPATGLIGTFAALALLNVLPALPGWLHTLILLGFAAAFLAALRHAFRRVRVPTADAATRRLETDSGLAHRPLTTLEDRPLLGVTDPETDRLWQYHLARASAAARNIRLRWPHPDLATRDPYALRGALLVALVVGVVVAGPDTTSRLTAALSPDVSAWTQRDPANLEIWITPPDYTNLPPLLLASADLTGLPAPNAEKNGPIEIPAGSILLAQVTAGRGTPNLEIGDAKSELAEIADKAWRSETRLDIEGPTELSVLQSGNILGRWDIQIMPDTAPEIRFTEAPAANESNSLRLSYEGLDDYGVVETRAQISWPDRPKTTGIEPVDLELPLPRPDPRNGSATSVHDLTSHPWAGLEVDVELTIRDGRGQTSTTDRLSVILPERSFNHPVAKEIIAQRRVLALSPENRIDVARSLHNLGRFPDRFNNDLAVFLSLMTARSRLTYQQDSNGIISVLSLLWDTALRLEDGSLSLAQRDVDRLQEQLREALENRAPEEEVAQIMEELRAALDRYLEALAQNLSQALEGMDLSTLPEAGEDLELLDSAAIQELMEQLEQMARLGDTEGVQELLERMQQMLQALQDAPNMLQQQQQSSSPAQQFLRELQQVLRNQEALHDETFQRDQRGEQMTPQESQAARDAQNEIRRQLGELMRQLGEIANDIPENLGNAEGAMSDAERALGEGDLQDALNAQARALDELRRGGQQMALQMLRQQGQGPGQGQGQAQGLAQPGEDGFDPLGRQLSDQDNGDPRSPGRNQIGDGEQAARALEILDELRTRLRDQGRPEAEIDYLLRLLRRF